MHRKTRRLVAPYHWRCSGGCKMVLGEMRAFLKGQTPADHSVSFNAKFASLDALSSFIIFISHFASSDLIGPLPSLYITLEITNQETTHLSQTCCQSGCSALSDFYSLPRFPYRLMSAMISVSGSSLYVEISSWFRSADDTSGDWERVKCTLVEILPPWWILRFQITRLHASLSAACYSS